MRRLIALVVALAGIATITVVNSPVTPASATTTTSTSSNTAIADAYVSASRPARTYGGTTLAVDASPVIRSYLRFAPVSGEVTSARIRLYPRTSSSVGASVHGVAASWSESSVTFANAPAPGAVLASSGPVTKSTWVELDVTSAVAAGTRDFVLVAPSSQVSFASRESGSTAPKLVVSAAVPVTSTTSTTSTTLAPASTTTTPVANPAPPTGRKVFAYYYLWWTTRHWNDKLGANYPYSASPLPLPATLDASGCGAVSLYGGNQLVDVPERLESQDDPGVIENHVRTAANAGLTGFIVNWRGLGTTDQTVSSYAFNRRLAETIRAVEEVQAEGKNFSLWLSYKSSDTLLSQTAILNDFAYLHRTHGASKAWDRSTAPRMTVIWTGSRKYTTEVVAAVSSAWRSTFLLIGDERPDTWAAHAAYLDGTHYYWSSQNPFTNASSFSQLESFAATIRNSGPNPDGSVKRWYAPFTPGYNSVLLGGSTCVPRSGGETMRLLFEGNSRSNPDAWTFISWNEIAEGTYIQPMQRWGTSYLDSLSALIHS